MTKRDKLKANREIRLRIANNILKIISSHGRHFFSQNSDRLIPIENPTISHFVYDKGRLWYIDKWKDAKIFVHFDPAWRRGWGWQFSEGGTLLSVCRMLRDYILHKREDIDVRHFGPFPEWICKGDLWGYGIEEMKFMKEEIEALLCQTN